LGGAAAPPCRRREGFFPAADARLMLAFPATNYYDGQYDKGAWLRVIECLFFART
jgi:hypothetical protein